MAGSDDVKKVPPPMSVSPVLKAEAERWLEQCRSETKAAAGIEKLEGVMAYMPAFHYQQAIEKALKAVLIVKSIDFPRSHDLVYLAGMVETGLAIKLPAWSEELARINAYAVFTRYPGLYEEIDDEDLAVARQAALGAVAWAEEAVAAIR